MNPVHHHVGAGQEDARLQPERQLRERAMPVVVELDQSLGGGDVEQERRPHDQEADAQIARKQWDDEPVAEIGDQFALAPPGLSRIAGPEEGEHGEHDRKPDRDRHDLHHGHAHAVDDRTELFKHDATRTKRTKLASDRRSRYRPSQLRCREGWKANRGHDRNRQHSRASRAPPSGISAMTAALTWDRRGCISMYLKQGSRSKFRCSTDTQELDWR